MKNIDEIVMSLTKQIDSLRSDDIPKFIFIGGMPGAGKDLMIEKVKKDFETSDFSVIEADMYRHYFADKKLVEETVESANMIEEELLTYSLEQRKNVISISTLRSYDYIDNLISKKILKEGYQIYFYIIITNVIECALSTYERYIEDKNNKKPFPRLNRYEYLKLVSDSFVSSIKKFSENSYFDRVKFFVRGENFGLPIEIVVKDISKDIEQEENRQINMLDREKYLKRIENIRSQLEYEHEINEFDKVVNLLLKNKIQNKEEE